MDFARQQISAVESAVGDLNALAEHLRNRLTTDAVLNLDRQNNDGKQALLRSIWESSDLSADAFADEIAGYFNHPRIQLPDLLTASSLADRFSPRFLRESVMFPFAQDGGRTFVAVADPTDQAALRGAEIVLGADLAITIAFDDVAAVLSKRLNSEEEGPAASFADQASSAAEESIDSLRDLASGAPVVRAVNDLLEKAIDLRASDIHIVSVMTALLSVNQVVG